MRTDRRLSRVLHVLLHMARHDEPFTSDQIAGMFQGNPTMVRRMLGGLRERGYVTSKKGPGGGWTLACDLDTTTLLDIYKALDEPTLFAIGAGSESAECAVARSVDQTLGDVLDQARALILDSMAELTLAELARRFDVLCGEAGYTL